MTTPPRWVMVVSALVPIYGIGATIVYAARRRPYHAFCTLAAAAVGIAVIVLATAGS